MSDFSLMDAIECGIVKLPRVPVADNIPGDEMPMFRNLWEHIGKEMPKKGRGKGGELDPLKLPTRLQTALRGALRPLREDVRAVGGKRAFDVPPCFIVVCKTPPSRSWSTTTSPASTARTRTARPRWNNGRLALFRNFDETPAIRLPRPNTLLIDSEQLEAGDALDDNFRDDGGRRDRAVPARDRRAHRRSAARPTTITDQDLLREVMNTVGKQDQLGEIDPLRRLGLDADRGWDANTVTHVLGVRAFGTQLLCEQVVGRALRRQSYELNDERLFDVEYADVLGIPFDFTAKPVVAPPQPPRETVQVKADPPGARPPGDSLPARRGLSRRTARGAPDAPSSPTTRRSS